MFSTNNSVIYKKVALWALHLLTQAFLLVYVWKEHTEIFLRTEIIILF